MRAIQFSISMFVASFVTFASQLATATSAVTSAVTPSATFEPMRWEKLVGHAVQNGSPMEGPHGLTYLVLTIRVPDDTTVDRTADYFSAVGGYDRSGNFGVARAEVVSEVWSTDRDDNWNVEQWQFVVSSSGELRTARHAVMVQTKLGRVLDYKTLRTTPDEDNASWARKLQAWYLAIGL